MATGRSGSYPRGLSRRAETLLCVLALILPAVIDPPPSATASTLKIVDPPPVPAKAPTAAVSLDTLADDPSVRARSRVEPAGPGDDYDPSPGQPVFELTIPAISSREVVYQGADQEQLARGPGHYPDCGSDFGPPYCAPFEEVWPGERGRVVIGGHRTMAGADFFRLGELRPRDRLIVDASWGVFTYEVTSSRIVDPLDRTVIVPGVAGRELVLVTCHPRDSAAQRLIVYSRLVSATVETSTLDPGSRALRVVL